MRKLAMALKAVDEGVFNPDVTRSGRFERPHDAVAAAPVESDLPAPAVEVECEAAEVPEVVTATDDDKTGFIVAKLYGRLHVRRTG